MKLREMSKLGKKVINKCPEVAMKMNTIYKLLLYHIVLQILCAKCLTWWYASIKSTKSRPPSRF